jgi:hypothetical protein
LGREEGGAGAFWIFPGFLHRTFSDDSVTIRRTKSNLIRLLNKQLGKKPGCI